MVRGPVQPKLTSHVQSVRVFNLTILKFDRRRPPEDRHGHFQPRPLFIDLFYETIKGSKRAIAYAHLLTHFQK